MAIRVVEMSVAEFIKIPDNPRQRDTERHAAKAKKAHLKKLCLSHQSVAIASINGVPVCKVDGHTRAFLWREGILECPPLVLATVYDVATMAEAADIYTHFDSSLATENCVDKLSGACRESGLCLTSQLLNRHNFNVSLKMAHFLRAHSNAGLLSEYDLVSLWAGVLRVVDDWNLPRNSFRGSGVLSLMFILVASRTIPYDVLQDFFTRYANDLGEKQGKNKDGVQALREHMDARRLSNQMTGYENIFDMINKGYGCVVAFAENRTITNVQPSRESVAKCHAKARSNVDRGMFKSASGQ
jgi:hypothetical protein